MTVSSGSDAQAPVASSTHRRRAGGSAADGSARSRPLLVAGIFTLAVFAMLAVVVSLDVAAPVFQPIDAWWHELVAGPRPEAPLFLAQALNVFGGPMGLPVHLAILAALLVLRRWWSALFFVSVFLGSSLVSQIVKNLVDRPRPLDPMIIVDHGSFPSGHVITAAAVAVALLPIIGVRLRKVTVVFGVLLVASMIWSRTFFSAHWLSDTIAGALAGAGTALVLWWAFTPLLAADERRRVVRRDGRRSAACAVGSGGDERVAHLVDHRDGPAQS
jgi:membrane-associated phospholipid phosphatase